MLGPRGQYWYALLIADNTAAVRSKLISVPCQSTVAVFRDQVQEAQNHVQFWDQPLTHQRQLLWPHSSILYIL